MCIRISLCLLVLANALTARQSLAQVTTNTPAQAMFRVGLAATCLTVDSTKGRVVSTRLTERNIIAQATGLRPSDPAVTREFALVYNANEDSLQVVNAQATPVVDVVHFGGGAATSDTRQMDRFTFMFFPGQTNEFGMETNVFGTALITEHAVSSASAAAGVRANITGKLQFTVNTAMPLGSTNLNADPGTNAQICTGSFTTSRGFPVQNAAANVTTAANTNAPAGTHPGVASISPSTAVLGSLTGQLPSLTANGALPGLNTSIGTGLVPLTPFTGTTAVGFGNPVVTLGTQTTTSQPATGLPIPIAPTTPTSVNSITGAATIGP